MDTTQAPVLPKALSKLECLPARTLKTFFNLNIKTFSYLYGQIMLKLVQLFKRTGIQHVSSSSGRTNFMV